jgi:hypothetical protein
VRRLVLAISLVLVLAAAVAAVARAGYEGASGGVATPSVVAVGGGTDYSVQLAGRPATTDLMLVLDTSGSMNDSFGGGTRWSALQTTTTGFVEGLETSGFFTRGGKAGVVLVTASATTGIAPTADGTAIKGAILSASPSGTGSCFACGLQQATSLMGAIPGASTHRRIAYIVGDGANTGTTPTVAEAVAGAQAAGVERRVIGIGPEASSAGLEALASDGTAPVAESLDALRGLFAAKPTKLPGATNVSWSFHLAPGFTASAPAASLGSVTAVGGEVTWTIPALEENATLSFHATHDPAAGCAATSLLTGTTFADAEGDAAPAVGLGPLSLTGCAPPAGPAPGAGPGSTTKPAPAKLKPEAVISIPAASKTCTKRRSLRIGLKPPKGTKVAKATVKVGGKTKVYRGAAAKSPLVVTDLPGGTYKVVVTLKLSDGRSVTLRRTYVACPASKA